MRRHDSNTSQIDVVLNIAISFIVLFMLALFLVSPKKDADSGKIIPKAEFLISLEWDNESHDDLDLWVRDPRGRLVFFNAKDQEILYLDKDDLGITNDSYVNEDGETKMVSINKEIVTIRAIQPGRYLVNVHMYRKTMPEDHINKAVVTLVKINPFREVIRVTRDVQFQGQEQTFLSFTINPKGEIQDISFEQEKLIGAQ